ncbi:4-hydroxybenzoate 3-monooxygenase [Demequina sp. SYSU T00039]|uniref:4-hydroxybenzoate 3-monooxygenase n=1 Tax=Demequina lignilytica TaxID=3051663 RepID=A0AAW7M3A0_9MICO|nr:MULTISPECIES: 4-hydroxybenzoate 3-monooxygenase [unclassified Demequina]MDN4477390.1 4-hydroxybenzoate 3-monooxygenase [Demequina sp. SYSU T00039-1]MDN4488259.1 4-hydroxybenzoate 3-monooxygenase [Demequina sp. SYSU T00039]
MTAPVRTQVAIVGAGPAGLILSHLLAAAGIDSVILDQRSREEIESTIRAGILEQGTVDLLATIPGSRVHTVGQRHDGIELRFSGEGHRIDFPGLTGRSVWLYPQHEALKDLLAARLAAGQDLRFGVTATAVADADSLRPRVQAVDDAGVAFEVEADFVVGADGSHSVVRKALSGSHGGYFREYPFAWFGILCEAPPSAEELIYSNSPAGFALISQRSETVQRMYFQCSPEADASAMSEAQIWDTLQERVPGTSLVEGPIFQRDVLRFRSFVARDLRRGRVAIVGDAAHTVPPTGAKGMNLAVADVLLLARALEALLLRGDAGPLDGFAEAASDRIWKAQHFSWWMTSMLHLAPEASEFDRQRQLGELRSVVGSEAGRTYLAEAYTGWPFA